MAVQYQHFAVTTGTWSRQTKYTAVEPVDIKRLNEFGRIAGKFVGHYLLTCFKISLNCSKKVLDKPAVYCLIFGYTKDVKKLLAFSLTLLVLAGGGFGYLQYRHTQQVARQQVLAEQHTRQAAAKAAVLAAAKAKAALSFDKLARSQNNPNSIWVVVNKQRALEPKNYAPTDLIIAKIPLRLGAASSEMQLRSPAAIALEQMAAAAEKDGAHLMIASAYRSYNLQVSVYGSEVKSFGQATADGESARPGFSEHQTGLAVDLEPTSRQCEITDCFATTVEGQWLAAHAAEYGFMQRYVAEKVAITGYRAEAWHFRYVGTGLSTELKKQAATTLEEFFGLAPAPDYAP